MDEGYPSCYGRSWRPNDDECEDCDIELDCKELTRRRQFGTRTVPIRPASTTFSSRENRQAPFAAPTPVPRFPGEKIWQRVLKNVGLGSLSRALQEGSAVAEDERTRPFVDQNDDND